MAAAGFAQTRADECATGHAPTRTTLFCAVAHVPTWVSLALAQRSPAARSAITPRWRSMISMLLVRANGDSACSGEGEEAYLAWIDCVRLLRPPPRTILVAEQTLILAETP